MKKIAFAICLIVSAAFAGTSNGGDLKCAGRIVSPGDRTAEVFYKCGEPEWRDVRTEEKIVKLEDGHWVKRFIDVEEWIYNFGPTRFVRILTFHANRLRNIETMDYGYDATDFKAGKECLNGLEKGDRKPEVVVRCGPPTFVDRYEEEHIEKHGHGRAVRYNVDVAEWTYDFGPNRFMRILTFRNGRLAAMEERDYGYYR